MRRVGIGAGILLLALIVALAIPPVLVQYRITRFQRDLHAGMSADAVRDLAAKMQLSPATAGPDELVYPFPPPWRIAASCTDDYLVIVSVAHSRVTHWSRIKERLCVKS